MCKHAASLHNWNLPQILLAVVPNTGCVDAGQTIQVTVRFSPTEVEDCARTLRCTVPHLDPACPPLLKKVDGKVLRPWCHFELPESGEEAAD